MKYKIKDTNYSKPYIKRYSDGLEILDFEYLSENDNEKIFGLSPTGIQTLESVILNFRKLLSSINKSKKNLWLNNNNWKSTTDEIINHNIYVFLFNENNEYISYLTEPVLYEDNYTLPIRVKLDDDNSLKEILVFDINGKEHLFNEKNMITGSSDFQWALEHLFNTLSFECLFRIHLIINHNNIIIQRYNLIKKYPSLSELLTIASDINAEIILTNEVINQMLTNNIKFDAFYLFNHFIYFSQIRKYLSAKNLPKFLNEWSFEEKPFTNIKFLKPFHKQIQNSWILCNDYVNNKYKNILNVQEKKQLTSFLIHSLVISSNCHIKTFSEYSASKHSGLINKENIYKPYNFGELLAIYGETMDDSVVPYIQNFIPKDINNLRKSIQLLFPNIIIGLSHYKPPIIESIYKLYKKLKS